MLHFLPHIFQAWCCVLFSLEKKNKLLFINNNNISCCLQKTFLFQKIDFKATSLGLKKTAPL